MPGRFPSYTWSMGALSADTRPTVVLIGASNMTRGLAVLRALSARACGRPHEVLAAIGMGRSYGIHSSVFGRRLPPVLDCGLWRALDERPRRELLAVVGDVGNDLLYGQEVDLILRWVDECVGRLRARGARVVLTSLPPRVADLSRPRFLFFRSVLFPFSPLRYEALGDVLPALDEGLRRIAGAHGAALVPLRREWYRIDPIHILPSRSRAAWSEILAPIAHVESCPPVGIAPSLRTYTLLAERQWLLGREVRRAQPILRQPDGTTVALY